MPGKQGDVFRIDQSPQRLRRAGQIGQPTLFRLCHPLGGVVVAVEDDPLVIVDHGSDQLVQILLELYAVLQPVCILPKHVCHNGVQHRVGAGNGLGGAKHPEFKFIAGKGKGRCAVPVGGVPEEVGQHRGADLHLYLFLAHIKGSAFDGVEDIRQFIPQEHGNDCGGRFVGAQPVIVPGAGNRDPEQILVLVHSLDHCAQEKEKLGIFVGRSARLQEVHARIRGYRPVIVLAGAVHPGKGLFVQQARHAMLCGNGFHQLHGQLVVVACQIGCGVNGGKLMLGRSDLIVLRLCKHPQPPQLPV